MDIRLASTAELRDVLVVRGGPIVTVHVAQSLDGRLGLDGLATALSSLDGQRSAHAARAANDAVLVGLETVRVDNPRLTVRHVDGADPLRIVLASGLDVPLSARVFDPPARSDTSGTTSGARGRVLVIGARGRASDASRDTLLAAGAEVAVVDATEDGLVSIEQAMSTLAERGVKKLLVEGGARVLTSFFRARMVHRIEIEIAMRFLGAPGVMSLGALAVTTLDHAPELTNVSIERLGSSVLVRGDVVFR